MYKGESVCKCEIEDAEYCKFTASESMRRLKKRSKAVQNSKLPDLLANTIPVAEAMFIAPYTTGANGAGIMFFRHSSTKRETVHGL